MKETVLVTGGAGYIGSHTAVELIQAGFDVVIADNLSNSDLQAVEGVRRITGAEVPFEQIDCCDLQAMRRLFERHEFRSVIHFAASKAVGESVAEPLKYYRNNLLSFLNVVELMCDFGRPNILFSSSCTVYGEPDAQPVTEQTPRKPATSPYGNTKQISEDILRDAVAAHPGLRGIALRYFNPIGSHPSALIGELPRGVPQNLVPYVTQTAAGIRECLSIAHLGITGHSTALDTLFREYKKELGLEEAEEAKADDHYEILSQPKAASLDELAGSDVLPRMNPVMDMVRGGMLKFHVDIHAFDMGDRKTPLLVHQQEGEWVVSLGNETALHHWYCEDGTAAQVGEDTENILILITGFAPNRNKVAAARNELARRMKSAFDRSVEVGWLEAGTHEFTASI